MSTEDDGSSIKNVLDIRTKLPVRFEVKDPVAELATKLCTVLIEDTNANAAEQLAALGVASRALTTLLHKSGIEGKRIEAIHAEALRLARRTEVIIG